MRIYVLGCAGWMPGENQTSAILLEDGEDLVLLDAGTGVRNLMNYPEVLARHERLHLILSHYHMDHVAGLSYLSGFVKEKELILYGPGRPYYENTPEEILGSLFREEISSRKLEEIAKSVTVKEYGEGELAVGNLVFETAMQNHPGPSFMIRLGHSLIYATDTSFIDRDWNAAVIFHECWEIDTRLSTRHTSLLDILERMPQDARSRTYLIHTNPAWNPKDMRFLMEKIKDTGIKLAADGMVLEMEAFDGKSCGKGI